MKNPLVREIAKIAIGVGVLGAVMICVIIIAWGLDIPMLLGTLLGCGYAIFNFALTAYFVSQSVKKSENAAKGYMLAGYYLRMALVAVVIFWAIKAPYFNVFTAAIPLVFPRLTITAGAFFQKKKQSGGEEEK